MKITTTSIMEINSFHHRQFISFEFFVEFDIPYGNVKKKKKFVIISKNPLSITIKPNSITMIVSCFCVWLKKNMCSFYLIVYTWCKTNILNLCELNK